MRKLFAISMIAIHLLNLAGYNVFFNYYFLQSDKEVVQRIENNQFPREDLVEVKVKLNLPYMTAFGEYERIDGEYEVDGQYYKYVERKILNDTLYLLCLPDYNKTDLAKAKVHYGSTSNDLPSKDSKSPSIKKGVLAGEYACQAKPAALEVFPVIVNVITPFIRIDLTNTFIDSDCQPPDTIA